MRQANVTNAATPNILTRLSHNLPCEALLGIIAFGDMNSKAPQGTVEATHANPPVAFIVSHNVLVKNEEQKEQGRMKTRKCDVDPAKVCGPHEIKKCSKCDEILVQGKPHPEAGERARRAAKALDNPPAFWGEFV